MKEIEMYLISILAVLLLVTIIWGAKLSSPILSSAIVLTLLGIGVNKFVYEFRRIK
jgi:hypothetical protein